VEWQSSLVPVSKRHRPFDEGLEAVPALLMGVGGPASWDWAAVEAILIRKADSKVP
jgi:hypothetical protein